MRIKRDIFRHVAFRHLRDIKYFIMRDNNKYHKTYYRSVAQGYINELWINNFITANTRNLLTTWLYSI